MGNDTKIAIDLAGQQFRITPPGGNADLLRGAAELVNERVSEMKGAGVVDSQRAALLTALELAIELCQSESQPKGGGKGAAKAAGDMSQDDIDRARTHLDKVITRLDDALSERS
jgi:cell division protein ZapA (FtsZ GTPase activity inhibitor)